MLRCSDASDVRNVDKAHGLIWQTNLPERKHILRHKRLESLHRVEEKDVPACPDVYLLKGRWKQLPCKKNTWLAWKHSCRFWLVRPLTWAHESPEERFSSSEYFSYASFEFQAFFKNTLGETKTQMRRIWHTLQKKKFIQLCC